MVSLEFVDWWLDCFNGRAPDKRFSGPWVLMEDTYMCISDFISLKRQYFSKKINHALIVPYTLCILCICFYSLTILFHKIKWSLCLYFILFDEITFSSYTYKEQKELYAFSSTGIENSLHFQWTPFQHFAVNIFMSLIW